MVPKSVSTMGDVAARAEVAKSTVSKVLSGKAGAMPISEETRQRVLRAVADLHYVPNRLAGGLKGGRSNVISLVSPWATPELADAAEAAAEERGYAITLSYPKDSVLESEERAIMAALERRTDGILWCPCKPSHDYSDLAARIRQTNTPVVLLENTTPGLPDADRVDVDFDTSMEKAFVHLIDGGYQRIHYISHHADSSAHQERASLFRECLARHAMPGSVLFEDTSNQPSEHVDALLSGVDGPVALLCESDWFAVDVLRGAESRGLSVPDQVGVITMVDLKVGNRFWVGELVTPRLSAIRRLFAAEASTAIKALHARIEGARGGTGKILKVPTELIVRDSSRRSSVGQ